MSIDTSEFFLPLLPYGWESLARPDQSSLAVSFRPCGNRLRCPPVAAHALRVRVSFRRSVPVDAAAENRLTIVLCLGVTSPAALFSVRSLLCERRQRAISFPVVAFVCVFSCSCFGFFIFFFPLWLKLIWSFESSCFLLVPSYPSLLPFQHPSLEHSLHNNNHAS